MGNPRTRREYQRGFPMLLADFVMSYVSGNQPVVFYPCGFWFNHNLLGCGLLITKELSANLKANLSSLEFKSSDNM
jgi:hypothetical protein